MKDGLHNRIVAGRAGACGSNHGASAALFLELQRRRGTDLTTRSYWIRKGPTNTGIFIVLIKDSISAILDLKFMDAVSAVDQEVFC